MNKGITMTVFVIYQLKRTTDRDIRLGVTCDYYDKGWLGRVIDAQAEGFYTEVATIVAKDLDEVFEIGNFMGETQPVPTLAANQPMHSVSVGDLIHNMETDEISVVAAHGFKRVF